MKLATWNVNSIRVRLPRLLAWLERHSPDVLCLQETKVVDRDFPLKELREVGYHALYTGQKTYNGVALLSRSQPREIARALPGDDSEAEKRLIAAEVDGVIILGVYAPNGAEVGSSKYGFKLQWYGKLHDYLKDVFSPNQSIIVCGDFNVAPEDKDVWDPASWQGQILCSEPERQAFAKLLDWGLKDALRLKASDERVYTWWDYRGGAFHRGWGLRIDHILVSQPLAERLVSVVVDRDERKGEKPSDHAPVVAVFSV